MITVGLELLVILLLFMANGVFSMSEIAILSSRKSRLEGMAASGTLGAQSALRLAESPGNFLPTVQIGITLIGLFAGAFSGATLAGELAAAFKTLPHLMPYAEATAVAVVVMGLTLASVVIGELVPKRIALTAPEKISCRLAGSMEWLARAGGPIVRTLNSLTNLILRLLRVNTTQQEGTVEDEIRILLSDGRKAGIFHRDEPRMVESVLAFDSLPVREIMTPAKKLVVLGPDDSHETVWQKVVRTGHSNYPICEENQPYALGVVSLKSAYANLAAGVSVPMRDLMDEPVFLSPEATVLETLSQFKQSGRHVGIVRDPHGVMLGMVTLVDMLETVVGHIPSREKHHNPQARMRKDGSWLVDGPYDMRKLQNELGTIFVPANSQKPPTLAAYVQDHLDNQPQEGNCFETAGFRFEVIDMDRTSVDKVLVQQINPPAAPENHQ